MPRPTQSSPGVGRRVVPLLRELQFGVDGDRVRCREDSLFGMDAAELAPNLGPRRGTAPRAHHGRTIPDEGAWARGFQAPSSERYPARGIYDSRPGRSRPPIALFSRIRYRSVLSAALPRIFGLSERVGLLDDSRIWWVMEQLFGTSTFAETRIPLFIGATDLVSGDPVTLTAGRIADAVRASISMPVILRPWAIDGRMLVDGGASNPLPVDVAIREGCEVIIAMGFENTPHRRFPSLGSVIAQSTAITMNHILRSTYAFYSSFHHAEIIPVMPEFDRYISVTDTHLIPYMIEQGERAMEAELPYLQRLLDQTQT
jgi:hypothetical protein